MIPADLLAILLLYSLPASLENFRSAIESRDELPSPDILRIKVKEKYEARHKDPSSREGAFKTSRNERWKRTKNPKRTTKLRCYRC